MVALEDVRAVEWWTGADVYNLGIYLFGGETVLMYVEGAGRWKFAIDECLAATGRAHSAMPRARETKVELAPKAPVTSGDTMPSVSGDHLPADVEVALGDGSARPLAERWSREVTTPPADPSPSARISLRYVRAIRWAMQSDAVELHLDYHDGAHATLVLDGDGEVEIDAA